jgi:hypothetical protein
MSNSVVVKYNPVVKLGDKEVEADGKVFKCSRCCGGGSCVCCGDLNGGRSLGCKKCSCQNKIPSGIGECFGGSQCCYYRGEGQCSGGGCSRGCGGGTCTTNNPIFDTTVTLSKNVSCDSARMYVTNSSLIGKILNSDEVLTQCDPSKRTLCCKGDSSLGAGLCGDYWGPTNHTGTCDAIMQTYCDAFPKSSECACLKSDIPFAPECTDKRCHDTNAMKLSNMLNNPCNGNYMSCDQYITLDKDAKNNVIEGNTLNQTCSINAAPDGSSTPSTNSKLIKWVLLGAGCILGIVIIGGLVISLKPSRTTPRLVPVNVKPTQPLSNTRKVALPTSTTLRL